MDQCVSYLHFSGKRDYRATATRFVQRLYQALRGSKVWVGRIAKVYFASKQALGWRTRDAVHGHVLERVVVGGGRISSIVRGMFNGYASNVEYGVLREYHIAHEKECCGHVVRHVVLFRNEGGLYSEDDLLASNGMCASSVFAFLVSSHVNYGHYFSYLAVSCGRFALASSSKGRQISNGCSHFGQSICQFSFSGAKDETFGKVVFFHASFTTIVCELAGKVGGSARCFDTSQGAYNTLYPCCSTALVCFQVVSGRGSAIYAIDAGVLCRSFRTTVGRGGFAMFSVARTFGSYGAISGQGRGSGLLVPYIGFGILCIFPRRKRSLYEVMFLLWELGKFAWLTGASGNAPIVIFVTSGSARTASSA